jgi:hypothetical protein
LERVEGSVGNDTLDFYATDGSHYLLYHSQDCCESVLIEDICGDLNDIVGTPILIAYESADTDVFTTNPEAEKGAESFTWTFYRISTIKGSVVIRWYGESNGYYSESVDFVRVS